MNKNIFSHIIKKYSKPFRYINKNPLRNNKEPKVNISPTNISIMDPKFSEQFWKLSEQIQENSENSENSENIKK